MAQFVGIDVGNRNTKIVTASGQFMYETRIARTQGTQVIAGIGGTTVVTINDNKYLFGGDSYINPNNAGFQLSDYKLATVVAAMKKAGVSKGEIYLGIGMPFEMFYKNSTKDIPAIEEFQRHFTRDVEGYNISKVFAVAEGVSSYIDYQHHKKTLSQKPYCVILDIGGGSVERVLIHLSIEGEKQGVALDHQRSTNDITLGTNAPLEELQKFASSQVTDTIRNSKILGDLLLKPTFEYGHKTYDVSSKRAHILKEYAKNLYLFLTADIPDLVHKADVILCGGGSRHVQDFTENWCKYHVHPSLHATAHVAYLKVLGATK